MGTTTSKEKQDARLEHTEGGSTTRDDQLDAGVPMKAGRADEPVGPEDALGVGKKRGDYRDRVPGDPHESVPVEGGGGDVTAWVDEDGSPSKKGADGAREVVVDRKPTGRLEAQKPRTEEIGDVKGKKGGVETG